MTKKLLTGIVALVLIAGGIYSLNAKTQTTDNTSLATEEETLTVGAVLSLTGYGAQDSESIKSGLELAKKDLQAKGVNVTIEYQDDQTDPKQTVAGFKYFASKQPDVVVGPIWSYLVDSALSTIEMGKIITYSPSVTSEYIQGSSAYLFQGAPKNSQATPVLTDELTKRNITKVAIINTQGAWGVSMGSVFDEAIKDAGATTVVNEVVAFGAEVDAMPAVVTKIKASGAEGILWTGSKDGALALVKRLQENGMNIPVIGTSGLRDISLENLVDFGTLPVIVFTPTVSEQFVTKYEAEYGKAPNAYADAAYDGLMLLAEAKVQTSNATEMKAYLENMTYEGFSGTYTFDEKHDTSGGQWTATEL